MVDTGTQHYDFMARYHEMVHSTSVVTNVPLQLDFQRQRNI
jgi:hypothetical protein